MNVSGSSRTMSELAGLVFWSDEGFYHVVGKLNGREFMAHPKIVVLNS